MERHVRWLLLSGAILVAAMAAMWIAARRLAASRQTARAETEAGALAPQRQQQTGELPVIRQLSDFNVTNQAGARLGLADLRGRPWAVDLIFTRCPGPCATLTRTLREAQEKLPAGSSAGLMSLTSDPEFDSPAVLSGYAERFGARTGNWHFVTGDKAEIRRLATEELLLVLIEKSPEDRTSPDDLFLHSTLVVLIDRHGRLRSVVEGTEPGAADRIVAGLRKLETED